MDLFLAPDRMTGVHDPAGHLAMISCGAALHHARLTLAAQGLRVTVDRHPDSAVPHHVASLRVDGFAPVSPGTARLARVIRQRHTDLRPVTGDPLTPWELRAVGQAFTSHDIRLHTMRPDEILGLTVAAAHAEHVEPVEAQWHEQLALWTGDGRIVGAADQARLPTQPGSHDRAATFVVLHGVGEQDDDWLYAGEALSAGWLVATQYGISVMPFSAPLEQTQAHEALHHAVSDLHHPYLMMRLGRHASPASAPYTRRLAATQIMKHPA